MDHHIVQFESEDGDAHQLQTSPRRKTKGHSHHKRGDEDELLRGEFEINKMTISFVDEEVEERYCRFAYVNSGFYGGKLWHVLGVGIVVVSFLFYHPLGLTGGGAVLTHKYWIAMDITTIVTLITFATLFVERLYPYREFLFLIALSTHWPAFTISYMAGKSPQTYTYGVTTGCYFFCAFVAQARFKRVIWFLTLTPIATLFLTAFGISDYWDNHQYLEMLYWPLFLFPIFMFVTFERRSRRSFVEMEVATRRIEEIESKIAVTQSMVANFFPATPTDDMLTSTMSPKSRVYERTVMIVTDIAGFTAWTSVTEPRVVIETLTRMFTTMDAVAGVYNVEKVATVGDSFFGCIFGGSNSEFTAPLRCSNAAKFACEIIPSGGKLKIRIGIHFGDVIGGFVGTIPPKFDLFGPDVDAAKKMEQNGQPAMVHLSHDAYKLAQKCGYPVDQSPTPQGIVFREWEERATDIIDEDLLSPADDRGEVTITNSARAIKICEVLCMMAQRSGLLRVESMRRQSTGSGTFAGGSGVADVEALDDDAMNFHPLLLRYADASIETKYTHYLRRSGVTQAPSFIFALMLLVLVTTHACVGCVDTDSNRLILLGIAVDVITYVGYLHFVGVTNRYNAVITTIVYTIPPFASAFLTSDCGGVNRTFYTGTIWIMYFMMMSITSQFLLEMTMLLRLGLLALLIGFGAACIGIHHAAVGHDGALEYDWVLLIDFLGFAAVSYFTDFSLRSAFSAALRLKQALSSTRGRHSQIASTAMDVMLPTFVSQRLMANSQAKASSASFDANASIDGTSETMSMSMTNEVSLSTDDMLWEYPAVAVMFLSFHMTDQADETYAAVNAIIRAVEDVIESHEVQKVKTINTTMLCVAGINGIHVREALHMCIEAALEVRRKVYRKQHKLKYSIGINAGPCFGAVIGVKGLCFDIFGDTVNTASRMQSTGPQAAIQVPSAVRDLVGETMNGIEFVRLPPISVKGKGVMDVFAIEDKSDRAAASAANGSVSGDSLNHSATEVIPPAANDRVVPFEPVGSGVQQAQH